MFKTHFLEITSLLLFWIYISHCRGAFGLTRDPLQETVAYLQAEENKHRGGIVSFNQTQTLLNTLWDTVVCTKESTTRCQGCLDATELYRIVDANVSVGLQSRDFQKASVVLLGIFQNGDCKMPPDKSGFNYTYVDYLFDVMTSKDLITTTTSAPLTTGRVSVWGRWQRSALRKRSLLPTEIGYSEEQLGHLLDVVKTTYKPKSISKCFTSEEVFEDIGLKHDEKANESDVEKLSSVIISNLLRGECVGTSEIINPNYFVDSIFENYGTFGSILQDDLDQLLKDLNIGKSSEEHHEHDAHSWRDPIKARRRKRAVDSHNETSDHHHGDEHATDHQTSACYNVKELLKIFEVDGDTLSLTKFNDMCPSLIEQIVSGACEENEHADPIPDKSASVFGWATLGVFLVTLCSMIGIIIVPLASVKVYTGIMHLFVALAVSTLSGDALLHLIPEALGLHDHDEHQHRQEQQSHEEILGKVLVVVAAIYGFFLFERLMMICLGKSAHSQAYDDEDELMDKSGQHLSAGQLSGNSQPYQAGNAFELQDIDIPQFSDVDNLERYGQPPEPVPPIDKDAQSLDGFPKGIPDSSQYQSHQLTDSLIARQNRKQQSRKSKFSLTRGVKSISVMVLVGDAVHNVTDGIAIGVAFTLDIYVGISTCIAVFCHELPHEIGDFAVFLKNGLSFKTALFWSLMSNLGGFIGVYIGIALGTQDELHQWIFAATAGMFLYIALVDLMPEITHDPAGFNISVFIMHNVGLVVGWTLMIILAYFESVMSGVITTPGAEEVEPHV